jgi:transcriptional regulator with XRE-family HTH domain
MRVMDIRETRKALGLTQAELAEMLGVDHSTVSRLESGIIPLTLRTQLALEALLTRAKNAA